MTLSIISGDFPGARGSLYFVPTPSTIVNTLTNELISKTPKVATLWNGTFNITLQATDDPALNPTGWTYEVRERWSGKRYTIAAPTGTHDISDLIVPSSDGIYAVLPSGEGGTGTQGPAGEDGADGEDGKSVELQVSGSYVQWRQTGGSWVNLVPLSAITGPSGLDGAPGADSTVAGPQGVPGAAGKSVEIANDGINIKWRLIGDTTWTNIASVASLKGADGAAGSQGIQGIAGTNGKSVEITNDGTNIKWRLVGDTTWTNIVALTAITGPQGNPGSTGSTGPANTLAIGTVTTGAAGSSATATITGSAPSQTLNITIPRGSNGSDGAAGSTGSAGPANSLAVGTVTTGAAGSSAAATITGTSPSQTLNLTIPRGTAGTDGSPGSAGSAGPANTLTIGTITTGAAGSAAAATITGTSPNQVLNLTLPKGDAGSAGTNGTNGTSYSAGAWQTATLGANMATSAGYRAVQYRLEGTDAVRFRGRLTASAAIALGTVVFTLPVGMRPAATVEVWTRSSGGIALTINTDGTVVTQELTSGNPLAFDHLTFAL